MILDMGYKISRKLMPQFLYTFIKKSRFGREKAYVTPDTYKNIFNYYKKHGLAAKGKIICELGPGSQFYTAFLMLHEGAEKVILVDPILHKDITPILKRQLDAFRTASGNSSFVDLSKIETHLSLEELDTGWNNKIDFICSHTVLEHYDPLESFFLHSKRLLSNKGISINRVDLSDHTFHIFGKFPFIYKYIEGHELDYFKYSSRAFTLINDPKCYMNRIPLQVYLEYARKYGFLIEALEPVNNLKEILPHKDIFRQYKIKPEYLKAQNFTMCFKNP